MANTPNIDLENINILPDTDYAYDQIVSEVITKTNNNTTKLDTEIGGVKQQINNLGIESSWSLKQKNYLHSSATLGLDGSLNDLPLGIYNVGGWYNLQDTPQDAYDYGIFICFKMTAEDGRVQMYFPDQTNSYMYYRAGFNSYRPWKQLAPTDYATPWINATLQNGWTGELKYRKNNVSQLEVSMSLIGTNATIASGTLIARLPAGYYPARNVPFDAYIGSAGVWIKDNFILQGDGGLYLRATIDAGVKQYLANVQTTMVLTM